MNKKRKILWGGATASSQYEGGYNLGGKGLDTQDCRPYLKRTSNATTSTRLLIQDIIDEAKSCKEVGNYPFRQGSDGYHHIDEDIQLLKELGIDIYRFSISWARLYPHGDEEMPNEEGIRFYDHIFKKVHQAGMKIFLTMNHYAVPLYLVETYGGWTNNILVDFYLRFAKTVFEHWGEYIDYYLPFNEINAGYFSPYNGDSAISAIINSPFVGFDIFKKFLTGPDFWSLLKNTLSISIASLIFYFPAPIILALLLNEVKNMAFKRVTQTMVYIPHFISFVIVAALTTQLFSTTDGIVYHFLTMIFGKNAPDIMSDPNLFVPMIIGQNMWKETGYGTIIFLAALSGVDVQLYEAADMDGANRWQKMWHVTLPAIRSTIVIMLILKVGQILNTGYEQIYLMQNSMNRAASDVFDTYIYTKGVVNGNYSLATAAGMFKSVVSMVMVIGANKLAKVFGESGFY